MVVYGIPNCDTVRKARQWLDARGVKYRFHDYKKVGIDADLLALWADAVGWEKLLNRSGTTFRKLPDAAKTDLDANSATALMVAHPSAIKRPIVERDGKLIVGYDADRWTEQFA